MYSIAYSIDMDSFCLSEVNQQNNSKPNNYNVSMRGVTRGTDNGTNCGEALEGRATLGNC